ncbi:uroporphyrinogen decarboxylase [Comamonadaceae bacterium OH2545_COT-014]|nr:uroporphyrinogen decarboxylase [Comamonadaceae bacterium OH2545_COT-014]
MSFAPLQNDTFLRACLGQATDYTPVWLMRQAGRYLPEYRATREKAGSFMGLATHVDYATEVTLQPLARYPLDAAILFSDILTVPDAMGLGLSFVQGEGPKFARTVRTEDDVARLAVPDMDKLRYVFDAVTSIRRALAGRVPLIGFSGSPWTLACYMAEGGGSSDYRHVKTLMYARPDLMQRVLDINADAVAQYLNAQIDAGAQAVMVFDSWGGVLADGAFQRFSLASTARVLAQLKRTGADGAVVPRIVFTKGGGLWLREMAALDCDVLGLDWTMNLGAARRIVIEAAQANAPENIAARAVAAAPGAENALKEAPRPPKALQGQIDPNVLFAPPEAIRAEVRHVLDSFGRPHTYRAAPGSTHIFNLGHGISQFTPPEHVSHLVDEVHRHSRALRGQAMAARG